MKPRGSRIKSDIFVWSGKYQVGIAKVDLQHKKLVTLINTVANKLAEQADAASLIKVLDELASYANYHFKTEENLMLESGVDREFEATHRASHVGFVQEVTRARNAACNNPLQVSTQTLTFLSRWLILHILGTDMRMANEIIALEKGLTPDQARVRAKEKMSDTHEVLLRAMGELYENLAIRNQEFLMANRRLQEEIAFHRQAEIQLRKLSLAVEHSPASTFITDARGIFEYVNPKFVEVTGYTMEDLVGQTPRILKSGMVDEGVYADFWRSIADKNEWVGEFHNRRKNGELYWDKVSVTPIADAKGSVTHYLAIQEDVTEQKLAAEEREQSHSRLLVTLAELQTQAKDLALLNETSELLQTCTTADEAYRTVGQMAERLKLGSGGALAVAADRDEFRTVATWGVGTQMLPGFERERCWALRRIQLHEVSNPETELSCSHFQAPATGAYFCLPLIAKGDVLGLMHVVAQADCSKLQAARVAQVAAAVGNAFKLALTNIRLTDDKANQRPPHSVRRVSLAEPG